jgi:predicted nucleic acid-binding protein
MIVYFDTSALVPVILAEPGTPTAQQLWDQADHVVSTRLVYVEARAALAQAHRLGRVTASQLRKLVVALDNLYGQLDRVDVDDRLVVRAGELAEAHELRGYDAVHLAALERVSGEQTVLASGDRDLCTAAAALGIAIADTSRTDR